MTLKDFRIMYDIRQKDIAGLVGKDVTTICKYESFDAKPNVKTMCIIQQATGGVVTPQDFLTEEELKELKAIGSII